MFKRKRNVPIALLEQLVKTRVLSKLEHSEWATPMVYVKKKSKEIYICADFSTELNAALKDSHYSLFAKIDHSNAYLQIPVEEESSKLLCINMHHSLYKFKCLLFRVKVASAIFQQVIDTMLSSFDFSVAYLNILMYSKSIVEHKDHVHKIFAKIQDYGFKIKENKCAF